jgi:hypothetical protein
LLACAKLFVGASKNFARPGAYKKNTFYAVFCEA